MTDSARDSDGTEERKPTDWQLRGQDDTMLARIAERAEDNRRLIGRLYVFGISLAVALVALSGAGYLLVRDVGLDQQERSVRFCVLAQQAVDNASAETPVSPLLIASADVAGCSLRVPPGTRVG